MKNLSKLIISIIVVLFIGSQLYGNPSDPIISGQDESLKISCTRDLYGLVSDWAADFIKTNPGTEIVINVIPAESKLEITAGQVAFVSQWTYNMSKSASAWKILIGHDVIVPVISTENPYFDELSARGVKVENLSQLFSGKAKGYWGTLMGNDDDTPLNIYVEDASFVSSGIRNFLGIEEITGKRIKMLTEKEVVQAACNDPYGITFCRLGNLADPSDSSMDDRICFLPIDRNGNGKMDYMENIYTDISKLSRGVWIGKYPKTLVDNIYMVSESRPEDSNAVAFLKWIISDGQTENYAYGYTGLVNSEKISQLAKLLPPLTPLSPPGNGLSVTKIIASVLSSLIALFLIIYLFFRRVIRKRMREPVILQEVKGVFNEASVGVPDGLFFDRTHTWAFMEKDGEVRIGIDDFLQNVTGSFTRLKMKIEGEKVRRGEPLMSVVQNGKHLTVYAPVSGVVRKTNPNLFSDISLINSSPYGDGWIYLLEPEKWDEEVKLLKTATKYKNWLRDEFVRLKDFFMAALSNKKLDMSLIVLQDGGVIRSNVLGELGPEIWEDFQTYFLDLSK